MKPEWIIQPSTQGDPMNYSTTGIYGITIQAWDGDRELDWTEVNFHDFAAQLRDFADIIEEAE